MLMTLKEYARETEQVPLSKALEAVDLDVKIDRTKHEWDKLFSLLKTKPTGISWLDYKTGRI
jgi:hypothetical protein